jgi:hypothetical protein
MGRYTDAASGAVSVLSDVLDFRERALATEIDASKFSDKSAWADVFRRLGDEANFITRVVRYRTVPMAELEAEQMDRYAGAVASSVSALRDTLDLRQAMFEGYTPPSEKQLTALASDAARIVRAVSTAARVYDTKGLEAASAFGDALGSTVGAFTDTLRFNEGLLYTEAVRPDPTRLRQFAEGAGAILDVTRGLAVRARAIPAEGLAALQTATTAITAQADAMIRMAAVPYRDVPRVAGAFGTSGGALGGDTVNVYIQNPPAGMNVQAVVEQVRTALRQDVALRR